jgi:hypothetical protein
MSGYGPSSVEAVKEWIDQNCKHQVARAENRFFFEDQAEASMFKLIWETLG